MSVKNFSEEKPYRVWVFFHLFCFLGINLFVRKYSLDSGIRDGFFNQVNYVANRIYQGDFQDLINPFTGPSGFLGIVHFFRFVLASPWYLNWVAQYPAVFDSLLLLPFLLPVLLARFGGGSGRWLQPFLIYLPYFFSYRAVLAMCGIAYLFIYFYSRRNEWLMFVSLFLVNLSSGVVLLWLMIVFLHMKRIHPKALYAVLSMFFIMSLSFAASLVEKAGFFLMKTKKDLPVDIENQGMSFWEILETIVSRNTMAISLMEGDGPRFWFYLGLLASIVLLIWYMGRHPSLPKEMRWSLVAVLPLFLTEGLGAVSILICVLLFYLHFFNPPWRQALEERLSNRFSSSIKQARPSA